MECNFFKKIFFCLSGIDLSPVWLLKLGLFGFLAPKNFLNSLAFQSFDFKGFLMKVIPENVFCTLKYLYIYVFTMSSAGLRTNEALC